MTNIKMNNLQLTFPTFQKTSNSMITIKISSGDHTPEDISITPKQDTSLVPSNVISSSNSKTSALILYQGGHLVIIQDLGTEYPFTKLVKIKDVNLKSVFTFGKHDNYAIDSNGKVAKFSKNLEDIDYLDSTEDYFAIDMASDHQLSHLPRPYILDRSGKIFQVALNHEKDPETGEEIEKWKAYGPHLIPSLPVGVTPVRIGFLDFESGGLFLVDTKGDLYQYTQDHYSSHPMDELGRWEKSKKISGIQNFIMNFNGSIIFSKSSELVLFDRFRNFIPVSTESPYQRMRLAWTILGK